MDAILSVRISDDLKQKFNELAQSEGINNKEFMEQVVKYYELNRVREKNSNMTEDINELQAITSRMADIYINIVERNNVKTLESKNIHKNELIDKDKEGQRLKEDITLLKEEKKEEIKKICLLEKHQYDSKHTIKELQENNNSLKTLNNMQGEKILKLTESNEKYIKYKDEILKLKTDIDKSVNDNIELTNNLLNKSNEVDNLIKEINDLKQINYNKIKELGVKSKENIEIQKERSIFQMDKEILKLKETQQLKIQQLQESFNDRINGLLKEKEEATVNFRNMIIEINKNGTKNIRVPNDKEN